MTEHNQKSLVDELLKRVEALEAELAIQRALHQYSHYLDGLQEKEWVELFTQDGRLETYRMGTLTRREQGHADLARLIASRRQLNMTQHKHLQTVPLIEVRGNEASTVTYETRISGSPAGPYVANVGRYRDSFVRENGRWHIKERRIDVDSQVPEEPK